MGELERELEGEEGNLNDNWTKNSKNATLGASSVVNFSQVECTQGKCLPADF